MNPTPGICVPHLVITFCPQPRQWPKSIGFAYRRWWFTKASFII